MVFFSELPRATIYFKNKVFFNYSDSVRKFKKTFEGCCVLIEVLSTEVFRMSIYTTYVPDIDKAGGEELAQHSFRVNVSIADSTHSHHRPP